MKFRIPKLDHFSGGKANIYTVYLEEEKASLFDLFIQQFRESNPEELRSMVSRLRAIGHTTGASENFFRLGEWRYDDKIVALHELPKMKLRLYCIRYTDGLIIVGGGGPKDVRAWQNEHHLRAGADAMIQVSKMIDERMAAGKITITPDGKTLKGNLKFNYDEPTDQP